MDDFELPDDLKDTVEVINLDDEEFSDGSEECLDDILDQQELDYDANEQSEVKDLAEVTFFKHNKSVFTCDLSKDGQLAVTGGEDDMAYVWSPQDRTISMECTGHKDSVTEVAFNHNAEYVATGDMSGLIQVWSLKEKKLIWCYECDDLEWLQWHHLANILIVGSQVGDIYIWLIPQGNCKVLASSGTSTTCGKLLPDGKSLIACFGNGQVKLWDMKTTNLIWQTNVTDGISITSIDMNNDGTLFAVAPSATLLKTTDGKAIGQLLTQGETDVEAVAFNSELNILVTGSLSGQLCAWDVNKQALRHRAKIECAVTVLKWSPGYHVLVGATDGVIYVWDVRNGNFLCQLTGHLSEILSFSVSKDQSMMLSTSDDGTAKIFNLNSIKE